MSPETLVLIAGALLSLGFAYIPGLNVRFEGLESVYKRLIMLGLLVVTAAVVYGLACTQFAVDLGIMVTCDQSGLVGLVRNLVLAIIANQGMYSLSPKTEAVKRVEALKAGTYYMGSRPGVTFG